MILEMEVRNMTGGGVRRAVASRTEGVMVMRAEQTERCKRRWAVGEGEGEDKCEGG